MEQVDFTSEQRMYLQFIWNYFREYNQWPTHHQMDHFFNQHHPDLDIEDVWRSLPPGLTSHLDIHLLDNKASLTLPGIYLLEPQAPIFELFLALIQMCVDTFLHSESHEIKSEALLRTHLLYEPGVYQAGWLLLGEPNTWQSFSGPDQSGQWSCIIARGIRRFRGITSIEGYLEKRVPQRSQPQPQAPSLLASNDADVSPDISVQPPQVVLHPDMYARCWNLYTQSDYDNAVLNATKAIEVAVRKKAQLADDVVGVDVMTQAFKPNNPLLQYSTVKAEQEGMMALLRGMIQVYKNPQSHRFVSMQDASECLGILLMCSSLLSLIDRL